MEAEPSASEPRYRAVRLARRTINLSAGVEDRVTSELIHVANASMAIRLAELMNDEAERRALPKQGTQHVPVRFQLAHDAALPSPGAAVLYVHRLGVRAVAYAASEQSARRVARLLTHVDYPMDEHPGLDGMLSPPKAHDFGEKLSDLPIASSMSADHATVKRYRKRVLGVALWSWLPLIALATLAVYVVGWFPVLAVGGTGIALVFLLMRAIRQ